MLNDPPTTNPNEEPQAGPVAHHGPLATQALTTLRVFFDTQGHHPSQAHWEALGDIADTLERMASGTCPQDIFLSAIDPGIGKSQTTVHFARALLESPDHANVGMLVCVGRITEAQSMAAALEPFGARVAVLINAKAAGEMGGAALHDPTAAQVLITTQQRLSLATEERAFSDVAAFHFRGAPRPVRVWDEAWLPGVAITVDEDDLGVFFKPARAISAAFREGLGDFQASLKGTSTGDVVSVPDWTEVYGVTLPDLLKAMPGGEKVRDDHLMVATGLFVLAGKRARVWKDNRSGSAVLTYRDTLPPDLAPLLVLDASGRVRQTYADMAEHRGLKLLRSAVKDYSPLTIHFWKRAGSKAAWRDNGPLLTQGVADAILTKPSEQWLVVTHMKGSKVGDIQKAVRRLLPKETQGLVSFISWGSHMATNAFADVGNLILAGTLFMKPSHYVALTHLAQDRPTGPGLASNEEVARTTRGEHANLILQALCRGRVRKSDGKRCLPMDAYIIADARHGIMEALPAIFPGCTIKAWKPETQKEPHGKLKEALELVRTQLGGGALEISLAGIRKSLGMNGEQFGERVLKSPVWASEVAEMGLESVTRSRGAKVLVRTAVAG